MNQLSIVAILLLGLSIAFAQTVGVALIKGTNNYPNVSGTVKFTQVNDSFVRVEVSVSGLTQNPDGMHGIHVHQYGDLQNQTNGGLSVGSHFVGAGNSTHGCETTDTRHEGDMGNWQANGGGITGTKELDLLALTGSNSIVGLAVVVHQLQDDCYNISSSGKRLAWGVVGIAGGSSNAASNPSTFTRASCVFSPAAAQVTGQIYLQDTGSGSTRIWGYVDGLTSGSSHGFHVHQYGDITNSTGANAGGHYNPNNVSHALPPATTRHVGDLPNLSAYDSNGRAWFDYTSTLIALNGAQSVIGRAIIVHEKADDGCTQPTGNSGSRYAQCVIGVGTSDANYWNPATVTITVPAPQQVSCSPASTTPSASTPKASLAVQHAVELLLAFVALVLAF
jgi:Cu-Zn family superoxide dismutase